MLSKAKRFVRDVAVTIRRVYSPRFVVLGHAPDGSIFHARVWADQHGKVDSNHRFFTRAAADSYAGMRNILARVERSGFRFNVIRSWEV